MRGTRKGTGLLAAVLFGLCGCVTTDSQVKPPPHPEEYNSPPADDYRYTNPPKFPKDTLNKGLVPKVEDPSQGPGGPGTFGSQSARPRGGPGGY